MTSNVICDERFIAKLQVFMKQLPFLLCGSPGSGKKTSLAFAATKMSTQLALFDLAEISNNQGVQMDKLQQLAKKFDNTDVYGNILIFALFGAEHLNDAEAKFLSDKKAILVANDRTATLSTVYGKKTLWVPTMSDDKMIKKSTVIAAYCCSK